MQETIKKLKFKDEDIFVINAPTALQAEFKKLNYKSAFAPKVKSNSTLVFINNQKEFLDFLKNQLKHIEYDSVLWFAYPKGTSKIKTDINRDTIHATGKEFDLKTVTAVSIDETWSALRFRPVEQVGK